VITTAGGNDLIVGGAGNDTISTGDGADVIRVSGIKDGYDAVNGGAGLDRIEATTADTAIGLTAVSGIETITANGLTGVFVRGNGAANVLDFSATTLSGITRIEGGNGADTVIGSAGADTIVGGLGADRLTGGAGADVFRFNLITESRGAAFDTITDFTHLSDQIDLTAIDANTLLAGDQGFNFIGAAAFGHIAGELRLIIGVTGETRLLGDINGDANVDFDIHLAPLGGVAVGITGADILL
jgi:serralysin